MYIPHKYTRHFYVGVTSALLTYTLLPSLRVFYLNFLSIKQTKFNYLHTPLNVKHWRGWIELVSVGLICLLLSSFLSITTPSTSNPPFNNFQVSLFLCPYQIPFLSVTNKGGMQNRRRFHRLVVTDETTLVPLSLNSLKTTTRPFKQNKMVKVTNSWLVLVPNLKLQVRPNRIKLLLRLRFNIWHIRRITSNCCLCCYLWPPWLRC